jgi:hypothetical protein
MPSSRNPGRTAGWLYLFIIVVGGFSLIYPGRLIAPGDPAATARLVLAHETMFRLAIVSGVLSYVAFIFLGLALYRLFERFDRAQAALMVAFVGVMVMLGLALMVNDVAALAVLNGSDILGAFTEAQRQAMAMMFFRVGNRGTLIAETFWGLWLLPLAVLVIRSRALPRLIGVVLILAGLGWLTASVTGLLLPEYAQAVGPFVRVVTAGEMVFMLWLVIRGSRVVDTGRTAE